MTGKFEVHQHIFTSGARANGGLIQKTQKTTSHFSHSHFGGDTPHTHPETGPSTFTIDRADWKRATGINAGGKKKFTKEPTGEQLHRLPYNADFEVIVTGKNPPGWKGEGGGFHAAARMVLAFKGTPHIIDGRDPDDKDRNRAP